MTHFKTDHQDNGRAAVDYMNRPPENLVLNGYRGWLLHAAESDPCHLSEVWNLYCAQMSERNACFVMSGLEGLIRQLGICATCPLRFARPKTNYLCRDECLILGLIAGLQNSDEEAAFESASALTCAAKSNEVMISGGEFAMALKCAGQQLLPINAETIRWIVHERASLAKNTVH